MWKVVNEFLVSVDDFVWGIPLMVLILAGGILLTTRLGLLQMRRLPLALKWMFKNEEEGDGEISSFAALCTALSATIGTGNIVGVATAVCAGGPGALFWMLVAAFFGDGDEVRGGTSGGQIPRCGGGRTQPWRTFLLHRKGMGSNWKWLAKIFAFFGVCVGLFGIGTFSQVNGISSAVQNFFDPDKANCIAIPFLGSYSWAVVISSLILSLCVALILIGGLKRIATVSQIIVPFMAVIYFVFSICLILFNIREIPAAVVMVVKGAFNPEAVTGGVVGSMIVAMQKGIARGIFSNEAGLGSAPIAAAAAQSKEPVRQGLVSMTGTFIDTIVICTLTGLSIVLTGAWRVEGTRGCAGHDLCISERSSDPGTGIGICP
ncbi:MAG: alanine/glycine:cation symporter family protein [Lachnospiraceae bacterium]